jgi:hypothetical protein
MTTQLPLIFLDFDGVLNSQLWYVRTKGSREQDDLDREAIGYLNDLVSTTGARVVVSSTWRLNRTIEELQEILGRNGFTGEVIGKTIDMRRGENGDSILRGNEILAWIKDHQEDCGVPYWDYRRYVIFDDDSDMLYWQKDNYIKTDAYCGLTPNNCYHAKKILTGWDFNAMKA